MKKFALIFCLVVMFSLVGCKKNKPTQPVEQNPTPEVVPTENANPTVEVTPTENITPTLDVTPTEGEKLNVSFVSKEVDFVINESDLYQILYVSNKDCDITISCDKNAGYSLTNDYKVTFSKEGIYVFTITARLGDEVATDTMTFTVVELVQPIITAYKSTATFDMSDGIFYPSFEYEPEAAIISFSSDKSIVTVDNGIMFNEAGEHTITIKVTVGSLSDSVTIKVSVYNVLNLLGLGTEKDPYQISNADELALIGDAIFEYGYDFKDCYFKQTSDINLIKFENWTPIGTMGMPFAGHYDGNGYEISNLTIKTTDSFQGLFGYLTGVVENVTVSGEIESTLADFAYAHSFVGGIAGGMNNGAEIINCTNNAQITGDSYVGGIVGSVMKTDYLVYDQTFSKVINCTNNGKIIGLAYTAKNEEAMYYGGITGYNSGIIYGCVNYGEISSDEFRDGATKEDRYVGGIAGYSYIPFKSGAGPNEYMDYVGIENSINYGYVHGSYGIGGIVGQQAYTIKNCINEGKVTGTNCVGGITGIGGTSGTIDWGINKVENCENKGEVTASSRNLGGIVGYLYGNISDCVNNGSILPVEEKSIYYVGGIVGNKQHGLVNKCTNNGIVTASHKTSSVVGGVVGLNASGDVKNSSNNGVVTGYYAVGGIIGRAEGSNYQVFNCANSENGKVNGESNIGGIVGRLEGTNTSEPIIIDNCLNKAVVNGLYGYIGGVVGMHGSYNIVSNSENSGSVIGSGYKDDAGQGVGGISGSIHTLSKILNCTNNGSVSADSNLGGIVGRSEGTSADKASVIDQCTNNGNVNGLYGYIGGIVGMHGSYNVVSYCKNYGNVTGRGYKEESARIGVGGISGELHRQSKVLSCENYGSVTGERVIGGIVGKASPNNETNGFLIDSCINEGVVTSTYLTGKDAWVGGILGYGAYGTLSNCTNKGAMVNVNGAKYVDYIYGKVASTVTTTNNKNLYVGDGE